MTVFNADALPVKVTLGNSDAFLKGLNETNTPSPFFLIALPYDMAIDDESYFVGVMLPLINHQVKKICSNPVFTFSAKKIWSHDHEQVVLAFTDEADANKFNLWLRPFLLEYDGRSAEGKTRLFENRDVPESAIAIDYPIPSFDASGQTEFDNHTIELWDWIQTSCTGKVYRLEHETCFRFESQDDATLFKLRWL